MVHRSRPPIGAVLALAFVLGAAACQPQAPATPPPAGPTPEASPGQPGSPGPSLPTPEPTDVAAGHVITARIEGSAPVIASDDGPAGHPYALPAAFAKARDGSYVLFVVWFGAAPGDQVVTVSTSRDGTTWAVGHDPIYTDLGLGFTGPGPVPSSATVLDDGTWVLYGWGSATPDRGFGTWRATAPGPTGPWRADPAPVLGPGSAGAWDSSTAAASTVLASPDGWAMWYDGDPGRVTIEGSIGFASSVDGLRWDRLGEAVLQPGECGAGTSGAVVQPQVWRGTDAYVMLFQGLPAGLAEPAVYAATSPDGRSWRCASHDPILSADDIPGSQGLHRIHAAVADGHEVLFVESLGAHGSSIWQASIDVAP